MHDAAGKDIVFHGPDVSSVDPAAPRFCFASNWRSADMGQTWAAMDGCDAVYTSSPIGGRELYGRKGNDLVVSRDHVSSFVIPRVTSRESAAPLSRSFPSGNAEIFPDWRATWVDGCGGKSVFESMWPLAHRVLAGSIVSSLDDIRHALKLVAKNNHVICEGAGACAVAAGLSSVPTGKVVCVVSGGNIDLQKFCELVSQSD